MHDEDELRRTANPWWSQEDTPAIRRDAGLSGSGCPWCRRSAGQPGGLRSSSYRVVYTTGRSMHLLGSPVGGSVTELAKVTKAFAYAPHGYSVKFSRSGKSTVGDRVGAVRTSREFIIG